MKGKKPMKRNKRNTLRRIITTILCTAILITGISFDGTIDADAAAKTEKMTRNVTMKPGDVKKLTLTDKEGNDIIENYKWTSSDKDIAEVDVDFADEYGGYEMCLVVTAWKPGTVTVTGDCKSIGPDASITVIVEKPKATANQKTCKHKWKTTRKATCQRTGLKTCKKCKLQKDIKKTSHVYTTVTAWVPENDGWYHVYQCSGCGHNPECENLFECNKLCSFKATVKYDKYGNITPDSEYASEDDAYYAWLWKHSDVKLREGSHMHGAFTDYYREINERTVEKKVTKCKYCNKMK